jgi:hypothetical protein
VNQRSIRDLVELLRETLQQVEQDQELRPDDPILMELKRHIVRAIADLHIAKSSRATSA